MSVFVETSKILTFYCHILFSLMLSGFSLPMYRGAENTELVNVTYYHIGYSCSLYYFTKESTIIIAQLHIRWIFGSGLWSQNNGLDVL